MMSFSMLCNSIISHRAKEHTEPRLWLSQCFGFKQNTEHVVIFKSFNNLLKKSVKVTDLSHQSGSVGYSK